MNGRLMSGHRTKVWTAIFVAAYATTGCGRTEASAGNDDPEKYVKVINVEVETVRPIEFSATIRITGEAEPETDVTVSAEEAGVLESFAAEKGARLVRGQIIARINDDVLSAQVEEARAGAEIAASRYERQGQLWEEEGIGSEIAYLQAKADAVSADARYRQLQARLNRTIIRSPVAGTFDADLVYAGEIVQPGTPVARVVDASRLRITGGVPERFAPRVSTGDEASITFDILPGILFKGQIVFVGTAVDRQSRTFPIEIALDNPDGAVKPYMIANVRVMMNRIENAIVVSREVLLRTEDGFQALVVENVDGIDVAIARELTLGASDENSVVVTQGLAAADRLVVRGQQLVDPGDRVRIVGESE
ncbi:MAG: efflux RND transporter periplasmic adaptor subunit [Gemmatimonadales bacterium]|nr:MAG: efflux RND transporter periplasmic adaptor subunit [Gemmatimonadales bacterium]